MAERTNMLSKKELVAILDKWPRNMTPEYRRFVCAGCGREMVKAWHVHVDYKGWRRNENV